MHPSRARPTLSRGDEGVARSATAERPRASEVAARSRSSWHPRTTIGRPSLLVLLIRPASRPPSPTWTSGDRSRCHASRLISAASSAGGGASLIIAAAILACVASARSTSATMRPARMTRMRSLMPMTSGSSLEIMMIAMPFCANSLIRRWISALAPTSMPRVGSSMMRMRGSVASHFDRPTFCWLPPESFPTIWPMPLARIWNFLTLSRGERVLRAAVDEPAPRDAREARERDVLVDRHRAHQALPAAVLRHIGDAEMLCVATGCRSSPACRRRGSCRPRPASCRRSLRRARSAPSRPARRCPESRRRAASGSRRASSACGRRSRARARPRRASPRTSGTAPRCAAPPSSGRGRRGRSRRPAWSPRTRRRAAP